MALRWYVVHAYSNFENKVKQALEDRIKREGLEQYFGKILVPTEEIVEMRMGQQRKSERKFFPWIRFGADGVDRPNLAFGEGCAKGA